MWQHDPASPIGVWREVREDVPSALREGILRLVAHLYMNRGDDERAAVLHSGAAVLFRPYRVMRIS